MIVSDNHIIDPQPIEGMLRLLFTEDPFPVAPGTEFDAETFSVFVRGVFVEEVTVSRCRLCFGDMTFEGVVSTRLDIGPRLYMRGWGSSCYIDEAEAMQAAVAEYAARRGLKIGAVYNHWPTFRGHLSNIK